MLITALASVDNGLEGRLVWGWDVGENGGYGEVGLLRSGRRMQNQTHCF